MKTCTLIENKVCNECGECMRCDINPEKLCDNCCKCIEDNGQAFAKIEVVDIFANLTGQDEYLNELFSQEDEYNGIEDSDADSFTIEEPPNNLLNYWEEKLKDLAKYN